MSHNIYLLISITIIVDSGALQLADLPTLIQICQGRSPSLDLDSYEQIDDQIKNMHLSNVFLLDV